MAKDMLFATLDPTMRAVTLPDGTEVILSDTVGFISDLPTQLVAAFRATLEEVLDADLICHVRDISHPQTAEQAEDVRPHPRGSRRRGGDPAA
jgi:GTP-binding protein HflX